MQVGGGGCFQGRSKRKGVGAQRGNILKDAQKSWLPGEDSNLGQRIQSPLCYHYTTGQRGETRRLLHSTHLGTAGLHN